MSGAITEATHTAACEMLYQCETPIFTLVKKVIVAVPAMTIVCGITALKTKVL